MAWDPQANVLYIADSFNNLVRVFDPVAAALSTLAGAVTNRTSGFADATASPLDALFNSPSDVVGGVLGPNHLPAAW